jgi:methanogenic corrinoid protein MtbC1
MAAARGIHVRSIGQSGHVREGNLYKNLYILYGFLVDDRQDGMKIGEVASRTGVSIPTLRAWERRYNVLDPARTSGGHRLYSDADVARVQRLLSLVSLGWTVSAAAGEAARSPGVGAVGAGAGGPAHPDASMVAQFGRDLIDAVERFDVETMHRVVDAVLNVTDLRVACEEVLVPVLREVGTWWRADRGLIANEHVVSQLVRTRLLALLRTLRRTRRPLCLAVNPEGELHDVGLVMASLLLSQAGWAVTFVGADTPITALDAAVRRLAPDAVMVAAYRRTVALQFLERVELSPRVVLGGPGFRPADAAAGGRAWAYATSVGAAADALAGSAAPPG